MIPGGRQARVVFLIIVIAAAMGMATVGAAPPDPTVRMEPAQLAVRPDGDFEVRVMIDDVEDLGGFELNIAYDPSIVELRDVAAGDFLGSTDRITVPVGPQVDAEEGILAFGALSLGEQAGPSGSGVLAIVSGTALRDGSSDLRLEEVEIFSTAPERLSVQTEDGQVVVSETTTAGPSGSPDAPSGISRWAWILGAALLIVVAAAVVAFAVLRGKRSAGSGID